MEEEKGAEEEAEEPYVDYVRGGPGDSLVGKVMWALSLPLMIPMWCSIPDPQDKDRERYYPIAFVMSIIWIAIFSYFMVCDENVLLHPNSYLIRSGGPL